MPSSWQHVPCVVDSEVSIAGERHHVKFDWAAAVSLSNDDPDMDFCDDRFVIVLNV